MILSQLGPSSNLHSLYLAMCGVHATKSSVAAAVSAPDTILCSVKLQRGNAPPLLTRSLS